MSPAYTTKKHVPLRDAWLEGRPLRLFLCLPRCGDSSSCFAAAAPFAEPVSAFIASLPALHRWALSFHTPAHSQAFSL